MQIYEKFFTGIEGIDYTKDEQINFTLSYMAEHKIIQHINTKKHEGKIICEYLRIYQKILEIEQNEHNNGKRIKNCVRDIL